MYASTVPAKPRPAALRQPRYDTRRARQATSAVDMQACEAPSVTGNREACDGEECSGAANANGLSAEEPGLQWSTQLQEAVNAFDAAIDSRRFQLGSRHCTILTDA